MSFSREKNGGHSQLRIWDFSSIRLLFQSVSARLESLTAADESGERRQLAAPKGTQEKNRKSEGSKTQNSGKSER